MRIEEIQVDELIKDCIKARGDLLEEYGISFKLDLDDPRAAIRGDRRLLRAALTCLIEDAARRARHGGNITIAHRRDHMRECIAISDDGEGIPYEKLRCALDLFSRSAWPVVEREEEIDRDMMGLAVVRDVVDLHRGRVGVRNEYGEGSTFTLHLPRRCA